MELDHILVWMAGLSCGTLALRLGTSPTLRRTGWFKVSLGMLLLLAGAYVAVPDRAGLIVGPPWVLFVMLPLILSTIMQRAIFKGSFRLALVMSRLVALLHPMDGMRGYPRLVMCLHLLDRGEVDEAKQRLEQLELAAGGSDPFSRSAKVLLARAESDWESLLAWVGEDLNAPVLADGAALAGTVRALGEVGRHADMLALFRTRAEGVDARRDTADHAVMALMTTAMLGRVDLVDILLDGPATALGEASQRFWRATAMQVAGDPDGAHEILLEIQPLCQHLLSREVQHRLDHPLGPVPEGAIDEEGEAYLEGKLAELSHDRRFAPLSGGGKRRPLATWGLGLALLTVFAFQIPGGSTDMENLMELGALLVPVELTPGEWWRRLSAGFLHFGPVHLTMNLAGLLLLGTWLERAWGRKRVIATFLLCTLASLSLYPLVSDATRESPQVLVGASGGIMGLLGALLGWLIVGRTLARSAAVSSQLRTMLLLVSVQVLFDLNTPMVSGTAHILGLSTGLLMGLVLGRVEVRRKLRGAETPA